MKPSLPAPHRFLVPGGIAAALLIACLTAQPPTGWDGQYAAVNGTYNAQTQAITQRFQNGAIAITRMRPADSPAVSQARNALSQQFATDTQASAHQ